MHRALVFGSSVIILQSVLVACGRLDAELPTRRLEPLENELNQARNRWRDTARQGASSMDYNYGLREIVSDENGQVRSALGPLTVEVRGDIVSAVNQDGGILLHDPADFFIVEDIFDTVQGALNVAGTTVSVSYDEKYGYPLHVEFRTTTSTRIITIESALLISTLRVALSNSRVRWSLWSISNYDLVVQASCFCEESLYSPYRIEVRNDMTISAISLETGEEYYDPGAFPTILESFEIIEQSIEGGYATVAAEYDEKYGFPTLLSYDVALLLVDDERSYQFTEFEPMLEENDDSTPPSQSPQTSSESPTFSQSFATMTDAPAISNATSPAPFAAPVADAGPSLTTTLSNSMSQWNGWNISDYEYVVQRSCFCPIVSMTFPHRVQVRNGITSSVVDRVTGEASEFPDSFPTIPQAFDIIQRAIAEDYDSIRATFDLTYGFPTIIYYDTSTLISDDEQIYEFTEFATLQSTSTPMEILSESPTTPNAMPSGGGSVEPPSVSPIGDENSTVTPVDSPSESPTTIPNSTSTFVDSPSQSPTTGANSTATPIGSPSESPTAVANATSAPVGSPSDSPTVDGNSTSTPIDSPSESPTSDSNSTSMPTAANATSAPIGGPSESPTADSNSTITPTVDAKNSTITPIDSPSGSPTSDANSTSTPTPDANSTNTDANATSTPIDYPSESPTTDSNLTSTPNDSPSESPTTDSNSTSVPVPSRSPTAESNSTSLSYNLSDSMALWNSWNISEYEYVVERSCFCQVLSLTLPHRIQVLDGVAVSVVNRDTSEVSQFPNSFPTVERAFEIIQRAIDENYDTIIVTFDETYGFPTLISYDTSLLIADDEQTYEFTDFTPVGENSTSNATDIPSAPPTLVSNSTSTPSEALSESPTAEVTLTPSSSPTADIMPSPSEAPSLAPTREPSLATAAPEETANRDVNTTKAPTNLSPSVEPTKDSATNSPSRTGTTALNKPLVGDDSSSGHTGCPIVCSCISLLLSVLLL